MSKQTGRAWVFGDDVDTDLIYHNKYLAETDPNQMPQYAFEYYPGMENYAKEVKLGVSQRMKTPTFFIPPASRIASVSSLL